MATRQIINENLFTIENLRDCEKYVLATQRRLDKAVANNDVKSMQSLTYFLSRSLAVKTLAVWRITYHNTGKYTAGIDGVSVPKGDRETQMRMRRKLLEEIDLTRKPDAIRRVYIPKSNGKQRPLGIPTLRDRINQEILRTLLEPITEYHAHENSYGFRPKRSCQDAMSQLFILLSRKNSRKYVLEGDIKGCFDNISHAHILQTLEKWGVETWITKIINGWLKAGIFLNGDIYDNETGTPQGGIISPLLANVALTALDNFCDQYKPNKRDNGIIVRYADDFVIVCESEEEAKEIKVEITEYLHNIMGLTLSKEKSRITHIEKGFDFLGFNFRKYPKRETPKTTDPVCDKLLIKPQKDKVHNLLRDCSEIIQSNKSAKQSSLILLLNPKLQGWAMYYRHVVSRKTYEKIDYQIFLKLFKWANRRHPNKGKKWVYREYFSHPNGKRRFTDRETKATIFNPQTISIKRFVKVKEGMRVYDSTPETIAYWERREYTNAYKEIYSVKVRRLFEKYDGQCAYCKSPITDMTETHIHHVIPRANGGSDSYSNLRLLHSECHREMHANKLLSNGRAVCRESGTHGSVRAVSP